MSDGAMLMYNPARIRALAGKTSAAIDDLYDAKSDDPAAAAAMQSIREIAFGLDTGWMPVLSRVGADTSMSSWDSSAGAVDIGTAKGSTGAPGVLAMRSTAAHANVDPALIGEMLDLVAAIQRGDEYSVSALNSLLANADPETVAALLEAMGPTGLFELLAYLAAGQTPPYDYDPHGRAALAETLATALPTLEDADGFRPPELGEAMVDFLVERRTEASRQPELAVAFVISHASPQMQAAFVAAAAEHEMESGESLANAHSLAPQSSSPLEAPDSSGLSADPLAFALAAVGNHRQQSIELLADPQRREFLMTREYSNGLVAITGVVAEATASVDLYDPANPVDPAELRLVTEIAADSLDLLASRPELAPDSLGDVPPAVSFNLARIVAVHQPGFAETAMHGQAPASGQQHGLTMDVETQYDAAGGLVTVIYVPPHVFVTIVGAAGLTDEGMLILSAGLDTHHDRAASALVARGEEGLIELPAALQRAADLEGEFTTAIGHAREHAGRIEDNKVISSINLVRTLIKPFEGEVGGKVPGLSTVIGLSLNDVQQMAIDGLANQEDQAERTMIEYAGIAVDDFMYRYLAPFAEAGLIETRLIPVGTDAPSPAEFSALDPVERSEFFSDVEDGVSAALGASIASTRNEFKSAQLARYLELLGK